MPGITAPQTYQPLDLIYVEEAFAWVLPRQEKDGSCDFCFKSADNLIPCNECSEVKYCGTECQEKNSSEHSMECANMSKLDDKSIFSADFIRLIARVLFKIKGKDWKSIKRNVMGTEVSFDDLNSHYEEMTTNPRFALCTTSIIEALKFFIGQENLPEKDDLIKIIGKVKYSSGSFTPTSNYVFCFGMSYFDHECIPNANVQSGNKEFKVWALKEIIEGSEKITISRRNILGTSLFRHPISEDSQEVCHCTECSLPYGESVLTKIIDETNAYVAIKWTERILKQAEVFCDLDMEDDIRLKALVDLTLEKQKGVLGDTNALHLKILALKAMTVQGTKQEKKTHLKELERILTAVFGEYNTELSNIYKTLVFLNIESGNILEASIYVKKIENLEIYQSQ